MSKKGGRPSKLNPQTQARFLEALRLGASYEGAASYAGVHYNTFRSWMIKGQTHKSGQYVEFLEHVKEAEGQAEVKWLAKIEKAATDGQWTAAAWKLERRFPDRWGKQEKITYEKLEPPEIVGEFSDPWEEEE